MQNLKRRQKKAVKKRKVLKNSLKSLSLTPLQAWMNNTLQLFDVIEFVLQEIGGNADVVVTTFSTSEEFLRKMYKFRERGLVKSAILVADLKAARKTVNLLHFMQSTFDNVYLSENHSKVVLIANDKWTVSICTSQNQTRGNRVEAGMITTYGIIYDTFFAVLNDLMKSKSVKIYDVLPRAERNDKRLCEQSDED